MYLHKKSVGKNPFSISFDSNTLSKARGNTTKWQLTPTWEKAQQYNSRKVLEMSSIGAILSIYCLVATTTLQCPLDIGQVQSIFHVANAECHMDMIITSETGFGNEALYLYALNCQVRQVLLVTRVAWDTRILTGHRSRRSLLLVPGRLW